MEKLNKMLSSIKIDEKSFDLKPSGYPNLNGVLKVVYDLDNNNRNITMVASTMNDHLLWNYIRYNEPYIPRKTLTDTDQLT